MKRKIITGLVGLISQNGLMWCGGVVGKQTPMLWGASLKSINLKKMRKRKTKLWVIKMTLKRFWFVAVVKTKGI